MDIDSLQIAKSLPDYALNITGIVPQFGGKCFDITLDTAENAIQLAAAGFDYENIRKPLRLLGAKSTHVSVFVSVEFPDENLLTLLEQYGELKQRRLRRLYFNEDGFTHIERGVRVAEFTKITRDIPKKVVLGGIEVGFKYSGQPATCYRCQSTEHVVKDCPKRRRPPVLADDTSDPEGMVPEPSATTDPDTSPSLFTPPSGTRSYADATASEAATGDDHPDSLWADIHRQEGEAMDHATTRSRKRDPPLLQGATMSKPARTKSRLATLLRPRRPQLHQLHQPIQPPRRENLLGQHHRPLTGKD